MKTSTISRYGRILVLGLALAAPMLNSCKKQRNGSGGSGLTSIDAVTTGDRSRRNGSMCGDPNLANQTQEQALTRVFKALPKRLQDEFKTTINLYEVVTNEIRCRKVFADLIKDNKLEAESRVTNLKSCWVREDSTPAKPKVLFVTTGDDAVQTIHDNALVMSTYAYIEFYVDPLIGAGNVAQAAFAERFRKDRHTLAQAVLDDLEDMNSHAALAKYKELYGKNGDLVDSVLLQNFFLAELIDSYYCSDKTRNQFLTSKMTRTHEAIKPFLAFFDR